MLVHYIGLDRKIGESHKMNTALVLAGGTGTRLGADIPKQYIQVNGRMVIDYCLRTLNESDYIDAIWIVAEPVWQDKIKVPEKFISFSRPGKNRQLSIYNGLKDIQEYILNHYIIQ
jgi:D-ribitol-5-phosphate cytidylyltransferase